MGKPKEGASVKAHISSMKALLVLGAFFVSVSIALPLHALATAGVPVQGTPVGLDHEPDDVMVSRTQTNRAGVAVFQNVKPGKYRLTIGTINWGDHSTARGPISKKPTAVIEINVVAKGEPGILTIGYNTKTGFSDTFTVHNTGGLPTGAVVKTVTVTITQGPK